MYKYRIIFPWYDHVNFLRSSDLLAEIKRKRERERERNEIKFRIDMLLYLLSFELKLINIINEFVRLNFETDRVYL